MQEGRDAKTRWADVISFSQEQEKHNPVLFPHNRTKGKVPKGRLKKKIMKKHKKHRKTKHKMRRGTKRKRK